MNGFGKTKRSITRNGARALGASLLDFIDPRDVLIKNHLLSLTIKRNQKNRVPYCIGALVYVFVSYFNDEHSTLEKAMF